MNDNDKLLDLSKTEKKAQTKQLSTQAKLLDEIQGELENLNSDKFDMHLFLLLFTIFKESQADIRIKQYVANLTTDQFDLFKYTVATFNEFLYLYIKGNLDVPKDATATARLDYIVKLVQGYNDSIGETIFRLPDIESQRPSFFAKMRERITKK